MKIHVLDFEELSEPQSNAPVNEEDTAGADEAGAEQVEALEAQFLALEDLMDSWASAGKLTPIMLHQANEALPALKITHGRHSHESRYLLAMEGVSEQAWEIVRNLWKKLTELWHRFIEGLKRAVGDSTDIVHQIPPYLISKLDGIVSEAKARLDANQSKGHALRNDPEKDPKLIQAYSRAGGQQMPAAFKAFKQFAPQVKTVVDYALKYLGELENWEKTATSEGGHDKPMPKSVADMYPEFVKALTDITGYVKSAHSQGDQHGHDRVTVTLVSAAIHAVQLEFNYGFDRSFQEIAKEAEELVREKTNEVFARGADKENTEHLKAYQKLGSAMNELLNILNGARSVFYRISDLQVAGLNVGVAYLQAIERAYHAATHGADGEGKTFYEGEAKAFGELAHKYQGMYQKEKTA
jgi:hypothetical protein